MNSLPISLNGELFDSIVRGTDGVPTLRDDGQLALTVKDNGTETGRAIVCVTFGVEVDGVLKRAQTVTTMRLLLTALRCLETQYSEDGRRK